MQSKWKNVLVILKVANGFQKRDCPFRSLLDTKVRIFHNVFLQKLSEASYLKKKKVQCVPPHHLCSSPVAEHFNQLFLCFKDFSLDLQLVGVESQ